MIRRNMEPDTAIDVAVVIPVYRTAGTIRALVERVLGVLEASENRHEVVLVEDGSADDSWPAVLEVQHAYPGRITAVQLTRNYRQHNALMSGSPHSRGRSLLTLDDNRHN